MGLGFILAQNEAVKLGRTLGLRATLYGHFKGSRLVLLKLCSFVLESV